MSTLRIVHLVESLDTRYGGPATSVPALAEAQRRRGHQVILVTPGGRDWPGPGESCLLVPPHRNPLLLTRTLVRTVTACRPDLVHSHGLWAPHSWAAHIAAGRLGVPHVCAPRGMLDPWALQQSRAKKTAAGLLYQKRVLNGALVHALVPEEFEAVRKYGVKGPAVVVPNGINRDVLTRVRDRAAFDARFPGLRGKRVALFFSRLQPKKGLVPLLQAWRSLRRPGWHLAIAGTGPERYRTEIEALISCLCLRESVSLLGHQEDVATCYLAADIFVLPSLSEGFSMAVLEALGHGVPVCITPACNFSDVARYGAGVVCMPDPTSLALGLAPLLDRTPAERTGMGRRGRELVAERYTWERVAHQMDDAYASLRAHGRLPHRAQASRQDAEPAGQGGGLAT